MSAAEVLLALAMATAVGARWSTCTADAGTAARVRGGKGISKEGGGGAEEAVPVERFFLGGFSAS